MNVDLNLRDFENKIIDEFNYENAYEHMRYLVEEIGERIAGTEELSKAANYIYNELKKYGLNVRIDEFEIYSSFPIYSEFKILSPKQLVIESFPNIHSPSTLPEGIKGELVYVGAGTEEDYKDIYVEGKMVLAELSFSPPRPEKVKIAERHGAKAVIMINWGPKDKTIIGKGAIKWIWGNPTPETWQLMPKIPSINISKAAGEYLKKLVEKHKVIAWLRLENIRKWVKAKQPRGEIKYRRMLNEFVLIGGHLEAWGKTATCNSSGNSMMLELARILNKYRDKLRRILIFVFWDGHEIAEAAGSTWYVDNYWNQLNENCIAYINIDSPGIIKATRLLTYAPPEAWDFLSQIADELDLKLDIKQPIKIGDNSFLGIGIPYIAIFPTYPEKELKEELGWALLGWWYHSNQDTLDKIDKGLYMTQMKLYTKIILRLCNSYIIPFNFTKTAEQLQKELEEIKKSFKLIPINLETLTVKLNIFNEETIKLNTLINMIKSKKINNAANQINKCLMKLSRIITPAFRTIAGRYGQDPYGYTLLTKPMPRLYRILKEINKCQNENQLKLLTTKLVREHNCLLDAIHEANQTIRNTIEIVEYKYKIQIEN